MDLDGTLFDSESNLSKRNKAAVRAFTASGGVSCIATGRWRDFTVQTAAQMGDSIRFLVCQDGGLVLERADKDDVPTSSGAGGDGWRTLAVNLHTTAATASVLRRIEGALGSDVHFGVVRLGRGSLMSSEAYVDLLKELPSFKRMLEQRKDDHQMHVSTDFLRTLESETDDHVCWLRVLPATRGTRAEELLARIQPLLAAEAVATGGRWTAAASDWRLADGTGGVVLKKSGVNKAVGLGQVSARLGWAPDGRGWLAFGDNWNDVEMLRWAARSVAPANAKHEGALEAAKSFHPRSNGEDFVACVLEAEAGAETEAEEAEAGRGAVARAGGGRVAAEDDRGDRGRERAGVAKL
jgi:hydroxymethylpyrimidine pyrophosphatase-like HAD family hydrolase